MIIASYTGSRIFGTLVVIIVNCGYLGALIVLVRDPSSRQEVQLKSGPFLGIIIMDAFNLYGAVFLRSHDSILP